MKDGIAIPEVKEFTAAALPTEMNTLEVSSAQIAVFYLLG